MECCSEGYSLGFRTFVLQGGEDMYYTDDMMTDMQDDGTTQPGTRSHHSAQRVSVKRNLQRKRWGEGKGVPLKQGAFSIKNSEL